MYCDCPNVFRLIIIVQRECDGVYGINQRSEQGLIPDFLCMLHWHKYMGDESNIFTTFYSGILQHVKWIVAKSEGFGFVW